MNMNVNERVTKEIFLATGLPYFNWLLAKLPFSYVLFFTLFTILQLNKIKTGLKLTAKKNNWIWNEILKKNKHFSFLLNDLSRP